MGNHKKHNTEVEFLLTKMGSRTMPNTDKTAATKAAVRAHWQQTVKANKQQSQRRYVWAAAASIMLVVSMLMLNLNQIPENGQAEWLATVSSIHGDVQWQPKKGSAWQSLKINDSINAGSSLKTTSQSHLNLSLNDQSEISFAANTEVIVQHEVFELLLGQLYHDTDESNKASPLTIKTSHGVVQHIGTRYLVSTQPEALKVAVRSGRVKMTNADPNQTDQLLLSGQMAVVDKGHATVVSDVSSYADLWHWTFAAQADFDLNNQSLYQFVQWYSNQTGLKVDWQQSESASKRVRLQGNIKNMSQEQAIKTVFYSTEYDYSIKDGVLQISHQRK